MNLLKATLYDPAVAVSKATSSLLAMTAFDTTNLRLAITVPAHGMVRFRLRCTLSGATTFPTILLGVLNGATVIMRVAPIQVLGNTAVATAYVTCDAEATVTGLTPGAMNVDAAYGVETVIAATNIKYGGPNDTTANNAWGGFVFEAWDPQPMPTAAPGAANGLQICGANAATTYATLTSTGALTVNGVSAVSQTGDGFAVVKSGGTGDNAAIKAKTDNLPAAPASTTNITAGTITTVTNLTNAPTAGDLTATMKTSVTTAATAATPTAAAVTGAVGSVAAAVTVGTNNDKAGYSLTQTFPSNFSALSITVGGLADITQTAADKVWGTTARQLTGTQAFNLTGNITGNLSGSAGSVTGLTASNLDVAVSSRLASGSYTAPDNSTIAHIDGIVTAGIDATISSRLAASSYVAPDNSSITGIKAKTDGLTFTTPGQVDVNVRSVNSATVIGDGAPGTEWGPA